MQRLLGWLRTKDPSTKKVWVTNQGERPVGSRGWPLWFVEGPPKASSAYTSKQLTAMGLRGWYKVVSGSGEHTLNHEGLWRKPKDLGVV